MPAIKEVDFDDEFPFEKPVPEKARIFADGLWHEFEIRSWSELKALVAHKQAEARPL